MKPRKAILWAVAVGLPLCAATFWQGTAITPSPDSALAQTADHAEIAGNAAAPAMGTPQRRLLMEYLRWQTFPLQERLAERDNEDHYWQSFLNFAKENSPNRYLLLQRQDLQQGSPVRIRMLQRWQNIEAQQDNPALYNVLVQEYKSEDRLIGLAAQLRRAWRQNNADLQQEIKQQIRFQAGQLVDLNLQQRALRIEQVRKLLTQEQADLDADARNRDQLADDRANQVMEQVGGDFRPLPNSNQPASSQPSPGNP